MSVITSLCKLCPTITGNNNPLCLRLTMTSNILSVKPDPVHFCSVSQCNQYHEYSLSHHNQSVHHLCPTPPLCPIITTLFIHQVPLQPVHLSFLSNYNHCICLLCPITTGLSTLSVPAQPQNVPPAPEWNYGKWKYALTVFNPE